VLGDPRLFAKVRRLERDHVTVEFFNSVVSRETRCVRKSDVAHTELPKHTRVFVKIGDFWKVGRVVGTLEQPNGTFVYSVKFPNIKEVDVHEDRLLAGC